MKARSSLDPRVCLAGILAAAALLRGANLAFLSSSPFFSRPVLDGAFCDRWALDILAGTAPAAPFYQDPLYPYLLAFVYRLFGHGYAAVYLLQLLLGLGVVAVVFADPPSVRPPRGLSGVATPNSLL